MQIRIGLFAAFLAVMLASSARADLLVVSTGDPDGKMAVATQPSSSGKIEIEAGDDFILTGNTSIGSATFTGLLSGGTNIGDVRVEIYQVFPLDSDVGRTSGSPTFSTAAVPTRVNSPSDVDFAERAASSSGLTFMTTTLSSSFTALNSVQPGGIHPKPGQSTGGDGAVSGEEVLFSINFTTPIDLLAGHYFFVPQVEVTDAGGNFYWLSAPRPIVPPGIAFPIGGTDLQAWTRDENLDPDWLRIGTDIVAGSPVPTFNMAFTLSASPVPEPSGVVLLCSGLLAIAGFRSRRAATEFQESRRTHR